MASSDKAAAGSCSTSGWAVVWTVDTSESLTYRIRPPTYRVIGFSTSPVNNGNALLIGESRMEGGAARLMPLHRWTSAAPLQLVVISGPAPAEFSQTMDSY